MKGNKEERRENEWEISERVTEHERHLTLGKEQGSGKGGGWGMGWPGDRHWGGGHLTGWALSDMLYVGKLNSNKKII